MKKVNKWKGFLFYEISKKLLKEPIPQNFSDESFLSAAALDDKLTSLKEKVSVLNKEIAALRSFIEEKTISNHVNREGNINNFIAI